METVQLGSTDKRTVFAKDLILPRTVLPLKDSVLISETGTMDIFEYKDTNNDGVSDEKKLWFKGGRRGGNMEHQESGLIWALDNNIYIARNDYALRFTDGEVKK